MVQKGPVPADDATEIVDRPRFVHLCRHQAFDSAGWGASNALMGVDAGWRPRKPARRLPAGHAELLMLDETKRVTKPSKLVGSLLALMEEARTSAEEDPFGNAVLVTARSILRQMERGEISEAEISQVITELRDEAFRDRAERLASYVGGTDPKASLASYDRIAGKLASESAPGSFESNREEYERTRFIAVFTAHPTFSTPAKIFQALAEAACGRPPKEKFASHRPSTPTLEEEFAQAIHAVGNARDAIDRLN
jgi:phosphoenolpyruvate carboxylase